MGRESPHSLWFSLGRMSSSQSDCIKIKYVNRKSEMTPSEDSLLQFPREGDTSFHEGPQGEVKVCQEMGVESRRGEKLAGAFTVVSLGGAGELG